MKTYRQRLNRAAVCFAYTFYAAESYVALIL